MQKYIEVLKLSPLFKLLSSKDIENLLGLLNPKIKKFSKGDFIISSGDKISDIAILLEGNVQILKEDIGGQKSIIAECSIGDMFAEAFACANIKHSPVTVISSTPSNIMFINFESLIKQKEINSIAINLLRIFAQKNIFLTSKLEHISKRSIREKILSYLHEEHAKAQKDIFQIPFSRTDLADFLFIDRSAMTRELSNMKKEGIIEFEGQSFKLNTI